MPYSRPILMFSNYTIVTEWDLGLGRDVNLILHQSGIYINTEHQYYDARLL